MERGLRIVRGYVQVRLIIGGKYYHKNFGPDSPLARELAGIHLSEKRKEILMNKAGITAELSTKKFKEAAKIWFKLWVNETNSDGTPTHNERSITETGRTIDRCLIPTFGKRDYDAIRPVDVQRWRLDLLKSGLSGTGVNRYQTVLSSIFNGIERAIKLEAIDAFKLPCDPETGKVWNPTKFVEKAPTVKRTRVLTHYEAKKLKLGFMQVGDPDGWEICKLALKSVLSEKDLRKLELGQEIDIERSKTGVPINIPIVHLVRLKWYGWRKRWQKATEAAGLAKYTIKTDAKGRKRRVLDPAFPEHVQFRDLRKTGINWLKGRHDLKLISEYAGHADIKTTEQSYTVSQSEYLKPLAEDINAQVESL